MEPNQPYLGDPYKPYEEPAKKRGMSVTLRLSIGLIAILLAIAAYGVVMMVMVKPTTPKASTAETYAITERVRQMLRTGDYEGAYKLGNEAVDGILRDRPEDLNNLAWYIVDPYAKPAQQDLKLAKKAADRACELTERSNWYMLDTLARVEYDLGNTQKAIAVQREAIEKAPPESMAVAAEPLKLYTAKEPPPKQPAGKK